jgi:hypothetical protein
VSDPPFQTMVQFVAVPVRVALGEEQVMLLPVAVTVGGVVFVVTVTVAVLVQPLAGSVAVTVYVPAAVTVAGFAALLSEPPFQTMLPDEVPVSVAEELMQLILVLDAVTVGGVVFAVTVTVVVFWHPVTGSVAVQV